MNGFAGGKVDKEWFYYYYGFIFIFFFDRENNNIDNGK
jgi:hypothetical protein